MENKEFFSELKVVLDCLRRQPHMLGAVKIHLSQYDHPTAARRLMAPNRLRNQGLGRHSTYVTDLCYFYDMVLDMYFIMWELLTDFGIDATRRKRLLRAWLHKVASWHVNFRELGLLLKAYEDFILAPLTDTSDGVPEKVSYASFKETCRTSFPSTYWWFYPLRDILISWLRDGNANAFRLAYQAVEYMLRANLKSLDLQQELCDDYVAQEQVFHAVRLDPSVAKQFEKVAHLCLDGRRRSFRMSEFIPAHGPGASSGLKGRKSLYFKYNALLRNPNWVKRLPALDEWLLSDELRGSSPLSSEIVAVPKNYNKLRIISKEPITLQYVQHGLHHVLYRLIRDVSSLFAPHIDLEHSEWNGQMAMLGSIDGSFATVDLSAASDSVTRKIIRRFPRKIRELLLFFRSPSTILPDGREVDLEKFAPMGADTCFPVECIVFAMCCMLAVLRTKKVDISTLTFESLRHVLKDTVFRVYGDDIVIEERYIPELYIVLKALGFKVNARKSYTNRRVLNFRESCGYEYLNGIDVSPLRTARKRSYWHSVVTGADDVTAMISYANLAYDQRLFLLRKLWLLRIKNTLVETAPDGKQPSMLWELWHMIPFIHEDDYVGEAALKTFVPPTNYHLMYGGLSKAPFSVDTRVKSGGLQQTLYWGLCEQKSPDSCADRKEIQQLTEMGFCPFEQDYIRWLEYWRTKLSPPVPRHYIPKELKLLQEGQSPRKRDQLSVESPDVCCTKTKLVVRPCLAC